MAQMGSRGGSRPVPAGLVTVADLLDRNAPAPAREGSTADDGTSFVTVGSLLNREGRTTRAVRPAAEAAAAKRAAAAVPAGDTDRAAFVRRGAVAAGALLAAGSVFGAAALTDTTLSGPLASGGDNYPGQGRLDAPGAFPPAAAVIGDTATTNALDAGTGAPTAWVPIAFPSAATAAPDGTGTGTGGSARNGGSTAPGATAGTPGPTGSTAGGGSSTPAASGGGGLLGGGGDEPDGVGGVVSETSKDLGNGVSKATEKVPVLNGVGKTVGTVVEQGGGAVGGLVSGLGETVKGVPKTLKSATTPLTKALPVTAPVTDLLFGAADSRTASAPRASGDEGSSDGDEKKRSSEGSSSPRHLLGSLLGSSDHDADDDASERSSGGRHAKADSDESGSSESSDSSDSSEDEESGSDAKDDSGSDGDSGGVVGAVTGLAGNLLSGR